MLGIGAFVDQKAHDRNIARESCSQERRLSREVPPKTSPERHDPSANRRHFFGSSVGLAPRASSVWINSNAEAGRPLFPTAGQIPISKFNRCP